MLAEPAVANRKIRPSAAAATYGAATPARPRVSFAASVFPNPASHLHELRCRIVVDILQALSKFRLRFGQIAAYLAQRLLLFGSVPGQADIRDDRRQELQA